MNPIEPEAVPAIPATVVTKRAGTESALVGTGDGGAVQIVAMPAWQIIGVRALRVYVQSLLGFLTATSTGLAGAVGVHIDAGDFLRQVTVAASLAVAPAFFSLLQNTAELLASIDTSRPTLRG